MLKISVKGGKAVERLIKHKRRKFAEKTQSVIVGFGGGEVDYAIYVHEKEDPTIQYTTAGTGPKFLEEPALASMDEIREIVSQGLKDGKSLIDSLYTAGEFVLEQAELVTPKDSGDLRESGFVERGSGHGG